MYNVNLLVISLLHTMSSRSSKLIQISLLLFKTKYFNCWSILDGKYRNNVFWMFPAIMIRCLLMFELIKNMYITVKELDTLKNIKKLIVDIFAYLQLQCNLFFPPYLYWQSINNDIKFFIKNLRIFYIRLVDLYKYILFLPCDGCWQNISSYPTMLLIHVDTQ